VESKLGPLDTSATYWPIVPASGDCEDGEYGGMNGRGNRSTRRKPAQTPLCPPQIPLDQTRDWTRAAAVGSQRLTASAMAWPKDRLVSEFPLESPPLEGEWPALVRRHLSLKRRLHFKTRKSFAKNKNTVIGPYGARNQDWLCLRGPAAINPTDSQSWVAGEQSQFVVGHEESSLLADTA
jgi:hypothetical protein